MLRAENSEDVVLQTSQRADAEIWEITDVMDYFQVSLRFRVFCRRAALEYNGALYSM